MQSANLKVAGMTCGGCTSNVTRALEAVEGVSDVKVSLAAGEAGVEYDERQTTLDQLEAAVKGAGYSVGIANTSQKPQPMRGCCG